MLEWRCSQWKGQHLSKAWVLSLVGSLVVHPANETKDWKATAVILRQRCVTCVSHLEDGRRRRRRSRSTALSASALPCNECTPYRVVHTYSATLLLCMSTKSPWLSKWLQRYICRPLPGSTGSTPKYLSIVVTFPGCSLPSPLHLCAAFSVRRDVMVLSKAWPAFLK